MQSTRNPVFLQLVPSLVLGSVVVIGLMLLGNLGSVSRQFIDFHWEYFGMALGLAFFGNTIRFLKRAIALRSSGIKGLSFPSSIQLFLASLPLDAAPSRIGDTYQGLWLFKLAHMPIQRLASVYLLEQLSDNLSIFFLTIFGALAYPAFWPVFLLILVLFLTATIFLRIKHKDAEIAEMEERLPFYRQLLIDIHACIDAHPDLFTTGHLSITLFLGVVSRAAEGAVFFFILAGLGLAPTLSLAATAILVYAFSASIANITPIPGGLGVVEAAMALMMTMLLNFQPGIAVAATLLFRLATFWINLLVGLLVWSVSGRKLGMSNRDGQIVQG
jgi:uncharacterized protein (TIRG00374 family)